MIRSAARSYLISVPGMGASGMDFELKAETKVRVIHRAAIIERSQFHDTLVPHLQCAHWPAGRCRSAGADHGPRNPGLTPQPLFRGERRVRIDLSSNTERSIDTPIITTPSGVSNSRLYRLNAQTSARFTGRRCNVRTVASTWERPPSRKSRAADVFADRLNPGRHLH
jgi:hypothetical protein